ncbi:immunity protein 31 (plasmid) [Serratia marcescens]|uniref:Imm31 family immunity protein n=1 Tax=Serratia marcescens TaxID=615 RepID=UPI0015D6AEDA|nr:Imm31 family immunity protein [Serratia marcescens]QLJ63729.1 immunity protein 31 [Serratia marcescens]
MNIKIDFYQEVEISNPCKPQNKKYLGKKGGIMGISEENGEIYAYTIKLYDESFLLSFDIDEVVPTGKQRKQEDYY